MNVKSIFPLLILFLSTTLVNGQNRDWKIGISGGPALVFLSGDGISKNTHRPNIAFAAGFSFEYAMSKSYTLHSNLMYDRKGSEFDFQITDDNASPIGVTDGNLNLGYLGLSVLIRKHFYKYLFINAGPYVGYLIKSRIVSQPSEVYYGQYPGLIINNTTDFKRWDLGLSAGTGFVFPIHTNMSFSVEGRYQFGLLNINEYYVQNSYSRVKTQSVQLLMGLIYQFPKKSH